jgi:uncharacterized protein (TIGR03083 family)
VGNEVADRRIGLVALLTAACSAEIAHRDPAATIPWVSLPTVAAMTVHLGEVHRWVTEIVRTSREPIEGDVRRGIPPESLHAWFEEGRTALLATLTAASPMTPCWVSGNRVGTVEYWGRRMVFENVKHLIDLRAAGGGTWAAAPEIGPDDYADGVDELVTEILPRTRPSLPPLPGTVDLHASDSSHSWRINPDWTTHPNTTDAGESVQVTARTSDLALMLWERADLLETDEHIRIDGSRATLAALQSTSVHPW